MGGGAGTVLLYPLIPNGRKPAEHHTEKFVLNRFNYCDNRCGVSATFDSQSGPILKLGSDPGKVRILHRIRVKNSTPNTANY